ncbi:hypothetical protein [uncultured Tenacibaculum sp.]|uniref:hypothetical protein n=1 Tax=uncultured Tenacibaculum sp. TaxID=174713 RepID=UPI0026393186|nr:hypothetical protein [uncultured Tenacibaculum sp.]
MVIIITIIILMFSYEGDWIINFYRLLLGIFLFPFGVVSILSILKREKNITSFILITVASLFIASCILPLFYELTGFIIALFFALWFAILWKNKNKLDHLLLSFNIIGGIASTTLLILFY